MNVYPKLQMFGPIARGGDYIMGGSDISSLLYNCHFQGLYKSWLWLYWIEENHQNRGFEIVPSVFL